VDIDRKAPVQAAAEVVIAAPIDLIWSVQADFEGWPRWNPGVKRVSLKGPMAPGTTFEWKAGGMNITSKLEEVDPPCRIGWTGRAFGLRAVHVWHFAQEENGSRVRTEESFDGAIARMVPGLLTRKLIATLEQGVMALKGEVERRLAAGRPEGSTGNMTSAE
jgi:uncharacterized protein YndB with AHSA1/START domain